VATARWRCSISGSKNSSTRPQVKQHQHAVHRGQADVGAFADQRLVDVFGGHVPALRLLEDLQDLQPRQRGLQAAVLEFFDTVHRGLSGQAGRAGGR
jgi:hypothetical protein